MIDQETVVKQAIILAGGKGTRLGALARTRPKSLVNIAGRPLVEHQLLIAKRYGIDRILFLTGHLGHAIAEYLGDGQRFGVEISYCQEEELLGTAGAVKRAEKLLDDTFFVFYGDIIFDLDLNRLIRAHAERNAIATLVVHPNDHPHDSDIVESDANDRIVAFHSKARPRGTIAPNLVSAGVYLLSRRAIDPINSGVFADFGLDIFPQMIENGLPLAAYNTPEYAKDVGTSDRLAAVERDILSGKVARRNLEYAQKAVFLDRDGVIIEEKGDRLTMDQVSLLPGVPHAISRFNKSDFLAVVATNQPGIAKGYLSENDVALVHNKIDVLLGEEHCFVQDYFICPHHPETGFVGERPELKIACVCRKPLPGLLLQAAERMHIDLGRSFLVGDRTVDIAAGLSAGVCTIGVRTGFGCADGIADAEPDFLTDDLASAAKLILDHQLSVQTAAQIADELVTDSSGLIAVAGLARSGKSVFARLLRWQLRNRGRPSLILQLDDFMRSPDERKRLPHVRDRYNTQAISPVIDEVTRPGCFLIVEGILALDLVSVRDRAIRRIFITVEEHSRRERFLAEYRGRGYSQSDAEALYAGRDVEERTVVSGSAVYADVFVVNEANKQ
jgi:histidinol-phosphate phosphatase family protein